MRFVGHLQQRQQGARTRPSPIGLLALFACIGGLSGCEATYAPPSLINKLRIVGVRAEPPVLHAVGIDQTPPVLSSVVTTLTPLVLGADPNETLCHAWSLCLFALNQNGNYVCVDPDLETSLGTGATATVTIAQAVPLFLKLPAVFEKLAITVPPELKGVAKTTPELKDASGTEVVVRIKTAEAGSKDVSGTCPTDALAWLAKPCTDRTRCLVGYKRLALAINAKDAHTNPVITGLELDGVDWPEDVTPTVPCYRGDDFYGQVGSGAVPMTPRWTPGSREEIGPSADPSVTEPVKEGLLFSWLSTGGDWDKQRTFDKVPANAFLPPHYDGKASQLLRIWMVARDGRNGTTWTSRQIEVRSGSSSAGHPLCSARPSLPGCPK